MAQIHKKEPIIKKRMETWSPKNKKKGRAKEVIKTVWSGMKIIGGKLAEKASDPKFQQQLGDFGRRAGSASRDMWGGMPTKKKYKKHKPKKRKLKR